jgi:hypothetical protein
MNLQAGTAGWRAEAGAPTGPAAEGEPELSLAKPPPANYKLPGKFADMP